MTLFEKGCGPKRLLLYVLILLWHISPAIASAAPNDDYKVLVNRASNMNVSEIADLADSAHNAGDDRKAMALYMSVCNSQDINLTEDNMTALVRAWLGAGDILFNRGSYADALRMYIQGLKVSDSSDSHPCAVLLYKNIGNVYCRLYDYERGVTYYNKALDVCRQTPDRVNEKKVLVNLSGVNVILNDLEGARKCHERARLISVPGNDDLVFMDKYNYGMILVAEKKTNAALSCFRSLTEYARSRKMHPRYICSVYQQLQKVFEQSGQNDSSFHYIKKCLATARENGIEHTFLTVQLALSKYYEKVGDMRSAQDAKNRYLNLKDSILDSRQFDAVKHVQFLYESEKVSDNINLLQRQKKEKEATIRHQRIVIACITALMLIVAFFLYYIYKQKKKIYDNYRNLYSINNKYMTAQEEMRRQHSLNIRQLKEKEEEIAALKAQTHAGDGADEKPEDNEPVRQKYSTSNLDAERLREIADAVSAVMDEGECFCNPDFNLDMLSGMVHSNSKYVSQAINETFGKNFSAYINEYRISLACQRLADTDCFGSYTVKAVGESVGFKSQSTFIKVFRKNMGMPPSVYQKIAEMEKAEGK